MGILSDCNYLSIETDQLTFVFTLIRTHPKPRTALRIPINGSHVPKNSIAAASH
jgi:hypothetical protein